MTHESTHDGQVDPCLATAPFVTDPDRWLDEPEGARVPDGMVVVDAHVHLFPAGVFEAIWRWFDAHGWRVRYRLHAEQVVAFLHERGVERFCALAYSHKPGLSVVLNDFMHEVARAHPGVMALGTVLPGEPDAVDIARRALGPLGLRGLKLHCHVQKMGADDPRIDPIYALCEQMQRPVLIHAGREPSLAAYGVDTRALCAAAQVERVLQRYPRLTLVVPHLGADEFADYEALLDRYENLYLDTTMAIGDYFTVGPPRSLFPGHAARLLYGTDFPNLPYAWDRELRAIDALGLPAAERHALLAGNALRLFGEG
ncbi:MAG: amidohydrolase [Myxococcales bacterium]|nr:MAG: amidohydrolase [Myxococcales bacterium]